MIDNIGLPYSPLNYTYSTSAPIGPEDADIMISLSEKHRPTDEVHSRSAFEADEVLSRRAVLLPAGRHRQPDSEFRPPGADRYPNRGTRSSKRIINSQTHLMKQLSSVTGIADLRIQQPFNQPKTAYQRGSHQGHADRFTQRDVAGNLLVSLSGSFQTSPSFWLDPKSGVSYNVATEAPQYDFESLQDLENIPVNGGSRAPWQMLGNLGTITRGTGMATVSHYDAQTVLDIFGSTQGRDLGGVARDVEAIVDRNRSQLPRGSQVIVRGQIATMQSSFVGLLAGLVFAILLIYLLIVVNFQSWLDPLIIISALPAALAGIVWMLFLTHTTISVPALTGSIMCMGVATANSILVVSFSKERVQEGLDPIHAAEEAGFTRFRPVIMTALAMIIGMVPMALGLGEGGEQNAPLGRAVIGGLLFATVATLLFVPAVYSLIHGFRKNPRQFRCAGTSGRLVFCHNFSEDQMEGFSNRRIRPAASVSRQQGRIPPAAAGSAATRVILLLLTVVVVVLVVIWGISSRRKRQCSTFAGDARTRDSHRGGGPSETGSASARDRSPRRHAAIYRRTDLCADQRLPEELERGYRRARQNGTIAG